MARNEDPLSVVSSGSFNFVRRYMIGIFAVVCLIIVTIFWGFGYSAGKLIKGQLHHQANAFFKEIVQTREWAANHGGIYVKAGPGVRPNPYLLKIPGLKVTIRDRDGDTYILKNPALITKEISELAAEKGVFKFRITSLRPLNPQNGPDGFERAALESFERGVPEYFRYEIRGREVFYRYMAPLICEKSCLRCHYGVREGTIRGGISITITATEMMQQLRSQRLALLVSALGIVMLILAFMSLVTHAFLKQLKEAEGKLIEMANFDFLTGLLNRREMFNRVAAEVARSERHQKPLSLILIDIDYFKALNDSYGHDMGDVVLKEISDEFAGLLREFDIICRYGGEEFLVALPETDLRVARDIAERLRIATLNKLFLCAADGTSVWVSISAGVAQRKEDEAIEGTISRADTALYRAKQMGRNRVEVAESHG